MSTRHDTVMSSTPREEEDKAAAVRRLLQTGYDLLDNDLLPIEGNRVYWRDLLGNIDSGPVAKVTPARAGELAYDIVVVITSRGGRMCLHGANPAVLYDHRHWFFTRKEAEFAQALHDAALLTRWVLPRKKS